MRILIAGGAGFIGSALVDRFRKIGAEITVADAFRDYAWPHLPGMQSNRNIRLRLLGNANITCVDLLNPTAIFTCLRNNKPEIVIHLAANPIVSSATKQPDACRADIVKATQNLLYAVCNTSDVERVIYVSSSMVYGEFAGDQVDEEAPTNPINVYGRLKLEAEQLVRYELAESRIEFTIVRPMAVYGPGDIYRRIVPVFCAQAIMGEPLTVHASPDSVADFTYVGDVVEGIALASLSPAAAGETFNLAYGEGRTTMDIVNILGRRFPELRYKMIPDKICDRPRRGSLDIRKARRLLGYRPNVRLEEGLDICIAHLAKSEPNRLVREAHGSVLSDRALVL